MVPVLEYAWHVGTACDFKWIWAGAADMLRNRNDLLKAAVEKLEWRYCSNFGIFSAVGVNGILWCCGGMVGSVHYGMVGAVDSENCSMVDIFVVGAWDVEMILVIC